ncbi:uncharacterized protein L3040_006273 [Drepanopeziza brunnea f. sp. 'multigermtubi']|uniref:uncharacterized protein n=1 Tax=Drepanopeziza brunnea f. sp. 'multigermtubi' TaxID=698441 RepID=UPI00239FF466|nr:hypothetical protein L3040_006273 [Drepanopeziza brunnea f. sp. 'multigermtubi']
MITRRLARYSCSRYWNFTHKSVSSSFEYHSSPINLIAGRSRPASDSIGEELHSPQVFKVLNSSTVDDLPLASAARFNSAPLHKDATENSYYLPISHTIFITRRALRSQHIKHSSLPISKQNTPPHFASSAGSISQ